MTDIQEFMDKVKKLEKNEKLDLSSDEDLSIGIMNLISIEEHLFFSGAKTGKPEYYNLLKEIRDMRKELLKNIIKDYEGEVWCISKHLLAGSMRLMEVGTKYLGKGDDTKAQGMFDKAYKLYSLFWGLNLGLIDVSKAAESTNGSVDTETKPADKTNTEDEKVNFVSEQDNKEPESTSVFEKLGKLVQKAIDCCKE